jgi:AbrB family looped-hinge helix DNA binding protein
MSVAIAHHPSAREIVLTVTRKGQVTIPSAVRRLLGLEADRKVAFLIDEQEQTVRLRVPRYPTIASVVGAAGALKQKISWKEMLDLARTDALVTKSNPKGDE